MGMFSEIAASNEAGSLEIILRRAMESDNLEVITFCKENIYPLYCSAKGESWGSFKEDKIVTEFYKNLI